MSSSTTTHPSTYTDLISLLSPPTPLKLEIEIIPTSISPTILSSQNCVAVPKPILTACFLHARSVFLAHRSTTTFALPDPHGTKLETSNPERQQPSTPSETEALSATLILTLFDPNYISALNFRKSHLWRLRNDSLSWPFNEDDIAASIKREELASAIQRELFWNESLVTSPLSKHAKSSALWAHRWWLVKWFWPDDAGKMVIGGLGGGGGGEGIHDGETQEDGREEKKRLTTLVAKELTTITQAASRHAGNYHAFHHAREVVQFFLLRMQNHQPGSSEDAEEGLRRWTNWVSTIHTWCLCHPRDISGWSFLAFLLDCLDPPAITLLPNKAPVDTQTHTAQHATAAPADIIQNTVHKTQSFVEQCGWQGASVEWFLRSQGRRFGGKGG